MPTEANPYVEQALDTLIEPVVAGVSKLRTTSQISAISMAVNAMCEAWTAHILRLKIRFRCVHVSVASNLKSGPQACPSVFVKRVNTTLFGTFCEASLLQKDVQLEGCFIQEAGSAARCSQKKTMFVSTGRCWRRHLPTDVQFLSSFSLCGAHQLGLDFVSVQTWLSNSIQNEEVKQSILALDVFKNLTGVVELLKRQPKGRSRSRGPPNRKQLATASDDMSKFLDFEPKSTRTGQSFAHLWTWLG